MMDLLKYAVSPMVLTASGSLTAAGGTAQPDANRLNTVFRSPSIITEIGVAVRQENVAIGTSYGNIGAAAEIRIRLGSMIPITNDFIPLYNLGAQVQRVSGEGVVTNNNIAMGMFRWVLPKPLFIPAGMSLESLFRRPAVGDASTVTAWVSYSGWYLKPNTPRPNLIDVPYVAVFNGAEGTSNQISNSTTLVNSLREDLHVQRMIGRLRVNTGDGSNDENELADAQSVGSTTWETVTIKMEHSSGWAIIREYVPFYSIFGLNRRTFDAKFTLKQNEYVTAYVAGVPADVAPIVSLIGHRQQRLA